MEIEKAYWPNGKLQYEEAYQNSKYHGVCRGWYESGQLRYEWPHQNGQPHGVCKWWHEDGLLRREHYYLYGEQVSQEEYREHQLIEQLAGL